MIWQATISNFVSALHFVQMCVKIDALKEKDTGFPAYEFLKESMLIKLKSDDKDNLHRRCLWIVKNYDEYKTCVYEVTGL